MFAHVKMCHYYSYLWKELSRVSSISHYFLSRYTQDQIKNIFLIFHSKIAIFEISNFRKNRKNEIFTFLNSEESLFELGENQIETAMGITIEAASVCPEGTNEVLENENMSNTFGVKLRKKSRFGQDLERSGSKRRSGIQNDTGKIQFYLNFLKS